MADNKTRRVIEVQSDLYQKGNLEKEFSPNILYKDVDEAIYELSNNNWSPQKIPDIIQKYSLDVRAKQVILNRLETKTEASI